MATQSEVARHLDMTQPAVADLLQRDILPPADRGQLDLDACRVAYIRHIREQASGRSGDGSSLAFWRTEVAKEKALEARRANELADRKIIPMEDAVRAVQEAIGHARAKILGVPSKAAPILAALGGKPQVIKERLTEIIHECLADLARIDFSAGDDSTRRQDGAGGRGDEPGVPDLGAAAEADGQRVGRGEEDPQP